MAVYDDEKLSIESSEDSEVQLSTTAKEVRQRTFSHWFNYSPEFVASMVDAGFYSCNINDCVICLKCNLIGHEWQPETDDPCELHRCVSPRCGYVRNQLAKTNPSESTIPLGQASTAVLGHLPNTLNRGIIELSGDERYYKITERMTSFASWNQPNLPSVEQFVRAGFFYTGVGAQVTCFHCHGSLDQWNAADDPLLEHAQRFPRCKYARQLCGEELYQKVLRDKRLRTGLLRDQHHLTILWFSPMSSF